MQFKLKTISSPSVPVSKLDLDLNASPAPIPDLTFSPLVSVQNCGVCGDGSSGNIQLISGLTYSAETQVGVLGGPLVQPTTLLLNANTFTIRQAAGILQTGEEILESSSTWDFQNHTTRYIRKSWSGTNTYESYSHQNPWFIDSFIQENANRSNLAQSANGLSFSTVVNPLNPTNQVHFEFESGFYELGVIDYGTAESRIRGYGNTLELMVRDITTESYFEGIEILPDGDLVFTKYFSGRDDGILDTVLGVDDYGNVKAMPVTSISGGGGSQPATQIVVGTGTGVSSYANLRFDTNTLIVNNVLRAPDATLDNTQGASLNLRAGRGKGSAASGAVNIWTAPAGTAGGGLNTEVLRLAINGDGTGAYTLPSSLSDGQGFDFNSASGGSFSIRKVGTNVRIDGSKGFNFFSNYNPADGAIFYGIGAGTQLSRLAYFFSIGTQFYIYGDGGVRTKRIWLQDGDGVNSAEYNQDSTRNAIYSPNEGMPVADSQSKTTILRVGYSKTGVIGSTAIDFGTAYDSQTGWIQARRQGTALYNTLALNPLGGDISLGGTLRAIDVSGSNIAGNILKIAGGRSTGSAAGGNIDFYVTPSGAAGSGLNPEVLAARFTPGTNVAEIYGRTYLKYAAVNSNVNDINPLFILDAPSGSVETSMRLSINGVSKATFRAGSNNEVVLSTTTATGALFLNYHSTGNIYFGNYSGGIYGMLYDGTNRRFGINTGSASYTLDVNGTGRFTSIKTSAAAPATTGTTKPVITDTNGQLSFSEWPITARLTTTINFYNPLFNQRITATENRIITKVVKSTEIDTVKYRILPTAGYTALVFDGSGVCVTNISLTANQTIEWQIAFNAGSTYGSVGIQQNIV